mmetsp:Transcript_110878/g.238753  ORF Transcript_110878/g.238753 Transcript_110878/m.238753 type:complete len:530 (-) Transcript_110878:159-1748(-)
MGVFARGQGGALGQHARTRPGSKRGCTLRQATLCCAYPGWARGAETGATATAQYHVLFRCSHPLRLSSGAPGRALHDGCSLASPGGALAQSDCERSGRRAHAAGPGCAPEGGCWSQPDQAHRGAARHGLGGHGHRQGESGQGEGGEQVSAAASRDHAAGRCHLLMDRPLLSSWSLRPRPVGAGRRAALLLRAVRTGRQWPPPLAIGVLLPLQAGCPWPGAHASGAIRLEAKGVLLERTWRCDAAGHRCLAHHRELLVARDSVGVLHGVLASQLLGQHLGRDELQELLRGHAAVDRHLGGDARVQYPLHKAPNGLHQQGRVVEEDLTGLLRKVGLDLLDARLQDLQVLQRLVESQAAQVSEEREPVYGPAMLPGRVAEARVDRRHVVGGAPQPLLARELVAGVAPEELADALEHHDVAVAVPAGEQAHPQPLVDRQTRWRLGEDVVHAVVRAPLQHLDEPGGRQLRAEVVRAQEAQQRELVDGAEGHRPHLRQRRRQGLRPQPLQRRPLVRAEVLTDHLVQAQPGEEAHA